MLKGLLLVERLIFDSISRCDKNINDIVNDTGLAHSVVRSVLSSLMLKNLILFERGAYKRQQVTFEPEDLHEEIVEIAQNMSHGARGAHSKIMVKKMMLNEEDAKILESMMNGIQSFLSHVQNQQMNRPIGHRTCEKKVVLLGLSDYSTLADASLKAV